MPPPGLEAEVSKDFEHMTAAELRGVVRDLKMLKSEGPVDQTERSADDYGEGHWLERNEDYQGLLRGSRACAEVEAVVLRT